MSMSVDEADTMAAVNVVAMHVSDWHVHTRKGKGTGFTAGMEEKSKHNGAS